MDIGQPNEDRSIRHQRGGLNPTTKDRAANKVPAPRIIYFNGENGERWASGGRQKYCDCQGRCGTPRTGKIAGLLVKSL